MTINTIWNSDYNDTKGSSLFGNATRPTKLPVGADGTVLTADSAQTTGVAWATSPASGSAFFANLSASLVNATGAAVTVSPVIFNEEIYDFGAEYNPATGVFTSTAGGLYIFQAGMQFTGGLPVTHPQVAFQITAGGVQYQSFNQNYAAITDNNTNLSININTQIRLTAGQTATCAVNVTAGAQDVTIVGAAFAGGVAFTWFSGVKIAN